MASSPLCNTSALVFGRGRIKARNSCNYNASAVINDIFLNPFPVTLEKNKAEHVKT